MKLLLILPSFGLTALLVVHAIRTRGWRSAFLFFVPAFVFGVLRGNSVALLATGENEGPYIFSDAVLKIGLATLPACVGWVFALYLSWTLAEGVVARIRSQTRQVFPLAAFALLAVACLAYAVETTASGVGWWRWNIVRRVTPFLVGGTHFFGIVEWMSVVFDFLVPFLLFRTERGSRSRLAWASLLLYPIHWLTHWKQVISPGVPHAYEFYHALVALSVFIFPLIEKPILAASRPRKTSMVVREIPLIAVLGMFFVLVTADLGVLGEPVLLTSVIPLAVYLVAARDKPVKLFGVTMAAVFLVVVGSLVSGTSFGTAIARAVPSMVPLVAVLLFRDQTALATRPKRRLVYATGVTLIILLTVGGMIREKQKREAYGDLVYRGWSLIQSGNSKGGVELLEQAVELKPNVNLAPKLLARAWGQKGVYSQASRYAALSLDMDPTDWESYQLAGNIHYAQGGWKKAIPFYERALMLNRSDSESAKRLAECFFQEQRLAEGIRVLRRAVNRDEQNLEIYQLLGAALFQTRDIREASRVVKRALEMAPEDPSSHLLMAYIHQSTGKIDQAQAECETVLRLRPGDAEARALLDSLR